MRLESRTGKDLTGTYPEVRAAVAGQPVRDVLLDGEVVAYDGEQTSFSRLQQRLGVTKPSPGQVAAYPVVYCVFDILEVDGVVLADLPLFERRARLATAIRPRAALQLSEAWRGDSQRRFAQACRSGWEGLIAKRTDAPYAPGRSKDWLKLKCAWDRSSSSAAIPIPRAAGPTSVPNCRLLRGRPAQVRRQGRHGLHRGNAP